MYSPTKKLEIPNTDDFKFPFKPYKIQEELMKSLYKVIENKEIGIFESPTGTGKSLTLTCGVLKWLNDHENLIKNELNEKLEQLNNEIKELELNGAKTKDWIEIQYDAIQKKDEQASYKKIQLKIDEYEKKMADLKKKIIKEKKYKKLGNFKVLKKNDDEKLKFEDEIKTSPEKDANDDLMLLESDDDDDDDLKNEQEDEKYKDVKIYFCSRTHSQLSQVVNEIKRTEYGKNIRCISLASRQNLCINSSVKQLSNLALINERCLDMQKSQSKITLTDNDGRIQKKSRTKQMITTKCPYKNSISIEELRDNSLVDIHDIEDLVDIGQTLKACPYYSVRESQKDAQIIMLPYQMLLHKKTRLQSGINLQNSIIIIDEAHNLLDTITNIYSSEINLYQLQIALNQLQAYKQKYFNYFNAKNILKFNQLIFITKRLIKVLSLSSVTSSSSSLSANNNENSSKNTQNSSRMIKTYELMHEGEFFNLNLYDILEFCEKSRLAQKVHGLAQRLAINEPIEQKKQINKENTKTLLKRLEEQAKNKKLKSKMNNSKIQKNDEIITKEKKNFEKKTFSSVIRPLLTFLESLLECANDGMILLKYDEDIKKASMKFILLNPGGHFQEIINECRSIIIAGGTMQPTNELINQLFKSCPNRVQQYFYDHVVPAESVMPFIIQKGPTSKKFLFNFTNRYNTEMLNELGITLHNICNIIPAGIVCFFGSYDYLDYVYNYFIKEGILNKIENHKFIFREPRSSGYSGSQQPQQQQQQSIEKILNDYNKAIKNTERNGAIIFSVVGGKLSEGLNFSDDLGRCIIVIGMPYPNKNSPELLEKIKYLNENFGNGIGNDYYENLCMKAVNQCIGRAIRHINDYACVLLLDERYSNDKIKNKLPGWILKSLKTPSNFNIIQNSITKFFHDKRC